VAAVVLSLLHSLRFVVRSRASLHIEIIALRHQLAVVNRSRRPGLRHPRPPSQHDRRRIVDVAVTEHPTAAWTAQHLRNAFPENDAPLYLLHDRDSIFADLATTIAGMNIQPVRTAPRSPWQNAYVERVIGSIRRECLDHVIVVNAVGQHRVLTEYVAYYLRSRTHLALGKDAPIPRPIAPSAGRIVASSEVGGLHHRYDRAAA